MRHCKTCGETGHNSRTCGREEKKADISQPSTQVVSDGARIGLWIVSPRRKRVGGKIVGVHGDTVTVEDAYGSIHTHLHKTIIESGYEYAELSPRMLLWTT